MYVCMCMSDACVYQALEPRVATSDWTCAMLSSVSKASPVALWKKAGSGTWVRGRVRVRVSRCLVRNGKGWHLG